MPEIITLPYGFFAANCFLVVLPSATLVIDPAVDPAKIPGGLPPVRWIVATHGHFDHISHADAIRQQTGAPLFIHRAEQQYLEQPQLNLSMTMQRSTRLKIADQLLDDGQVVDLTDGCSLDVLHTPGHTPGGICLLLRAGEEPLALFSGDTLFAGSIGRLDLGGSRQDMESSLCRLQKLAQQLKDQGYTLARDLTVYPGHGEPTGLLAEVQFNPYFKSVR